MTTHQVIITSGERPGDDTETIEIIPQSPPPPSGTPVPSPEIGMPFLLSQAPADAGQRWQCIQAQFVDDPRKAVRDAHTMAGELMQRISDACASQRSALERQWTEDDEPSTEELRICLQQYRSFVSRLSATVSEFEKRIQGSEVWEPTEMRTS